MHRWTPKGMALSNAQELAALTSFVRYSGVLLFDIPRFASVARAVSRRAQPVPTPCSYGHSTSPAMNKVRFARMNLNPLHKPLIYPPNAPVLLTVFEEKRSNNDK